MVGDITFINLVRNLSRTPTPTATPTQQTPTRTQKKILALLTLAGFLAFALIATIILRIFLWLETSVDLRVFDLAIMSTLSVGLFAALIVFTISYLRYLPLIFSPDDKGE